MSRPALPPGERALRAGRALLTPETCARTVEAAVADLRHEVAGLSAPRRRARLRGASWRLLAVLAGAAVLDRARAARSVRWWVLAPPALAVVLGAWGLHAALGGGASGGALLRVQLVWLALGLAVGAGAATSRPVALRALGPVLGWAAAAALLWTGVAGTSLAGARRWLSLGGLVVHTAALVPPLVALGLGRLAALGRRREAAALLATCGLGAALTADPGAALTLGLVGVAAALSGRAAERRTPPRGRGERVWPRDMGAAVLLGAASVGAAVARAPSLPAVPHSEGALQVLLAWSAPLAAAATLALAATAAVPLLTRRWVSDPSGNPAGDSSAGVVAAAVVAQLAVAAGLGVAQVGGVPLVGYGGSVIVACLLGLGLLEALAPTAPPPAPAPAEASVPRLP